MTTQRDLLVEIPDTPFWIADKVSISKSKLYSSSGQKTEPPEWGEDELILLIAPFQYDSINARRNGKENIPQYRIGGTRLHPLLYSVYEISYSYYAYEGDLKLVERGPIWELFHGGSFKFCFSGEVTQVLKFLGNYDRIENPEHGKRPPFVWSLAEALDALKKSFGDIIVTSGKLDVEEKDTNQVFVGKFDDRDLGRIFAEVILKRHGMELKG